MDTKNVDILPKHTLCNKEVIFYFIDTYLPAKYTLFDIIKLIKIKINYSSIEMFLKSKFVHYILPIMLL